MKKFIKPKYLWDYNVKKLDLDNPEILKWYLERKINYDDWKGLDPKTIKRHFKKLNLHPGKRLMLEHYFEKYVC